MFIDKYLPHFQFMEEYNITINATRDKIFTTLKCYNVNDDKLIKTAIALREAPVRLMHRYKLIHQMVDAPFNLDKFTLLETIPLTQIAYGLVGQFWQLNYGLQTIKDEKAFIAFQQPHIAKLVMQFNIDSIDTLNGDNLNNEATNDSYILRTTTKIYCPDRFSKRRFTPYWCIIRIVSGFIRKRMLKAIKKQSEWPI